MKAVSISDLVLHINMMKQENNEYPTYYIYDTQGRLVAESKLIYLLINGSYKRVMYPYKHYIWAMDKVVAQTNLLENTIYYYLYNGHGDVVQIVNTSGSVVNSYDYDIWGNFIKKQETIDNPFTYFGQTYDETTGLYYLRKKFSIRHLQRVTGISRGVITKA